MVQKLGYVWEILNQEITQILVLNLSFHDTLILFDSNRLPSSWMISTCKGVFAATHLKTHQEVFHHPAGIPPPKTAVTAVRIGAEHGDESIASAGEIPPLAA